MKYEEIIMKVAQAYGVAPPEVEAEMKAAVNAAKAIQTSRCCLENGNRLLKSSF